MSVIGEFLIGYGLTKISDIFSNKIFNKDLDKRIDDEISSWSKILPKYFQFQPATFFMKYRYENDFLPAQAELVTCLKKRNLPAIELWRDALFERWNYINSLEIEGKGTFFSAEKSEIEPYLGDLAGRLYKLCWCDKKIRANETFELLHDLTIRFKAEKTRIQNVSEIITPTMFTEVRRIDFVASSKFFYQMLILIIANAIYKSSKKDRYKSFSSMIYIDQGGEMGSFTIFTHDVFFYRELRIIRDNLSSKFRQAFENLKTCIADNWELNYAISKNGGYSLLNFSFDIDAMEIGIFSDNVKDAPIIDSEMKIGEAYKMILALIENNHFIIDFDIKSFHPGAIKMICAVQSLQSININFLRYDPRNPENWDYDFPAYLYTY